jgi:aerobic carbon-monoxide dehydrogenase small subunit
MIGFTLNGKAVITERPALTRLIDLLRDELGDTSVKEGCGEGECGACSVLLDGSLINSCILPIGRLDGARVVTMAGYSESKRGKVLIDAFESEGAVQCGFCIPGMVLAAEELLNGNPSPDEGEIRAGLSGNLCRCTGYDLIIRAVSVAAKKGKGLW